MKSITAIVLAVLALAAVVSAATVQSSPTYLWGSEGYFTESKLISTASVNTRSLREVFSSLAFGSPSSILGREQATVQTPKAIFTLTQNGLTSGQGSQLLGAYGGDVALSNLKSLTMTHVFTDGINVRGLIASTVPTTRVFTSASSCDDFVSYITAAIAAAGDRIANINAVSNDVETFQLFDQCLVQINEILAQLTDDQFLASIIGSTKGPSHVHQSFLELENYVQAIHNTAAVGVDGPQYITSNTVTALVVSIMLLIAAWIGFQCTLAIETPVRYAQPQQLLQPTKEY